MKAVSAAYRARSLQAFQEALDEHRAQLVEDPFVNTHLTVRPGGCDRHDCCYRHSFPRSMPEGSRFEHWLG